MSVLVYWLLYAYSPLPDLDKSQLTPVAWRENYCLLPKKLKGTNTPIH